MDITENVKLLGTLKVAMYGAITGMHYKSSTLRIYACIIRRSISWGNSSLWIRNYTDLNEGDLTIGMGLDGMAQSTISRGLLRLRAANIIFEKKEAGGHRIVPNSPGIIAHYIRTLKRIAPSRARNADTSNYKKTIDSFSQLRTILITVFEERGFPANLEIDLKHEAELNHIVDIDEVLSETDTTPANVLSIRR